jgi:hypothetical protein
LWYAGKKPAKEAKGAVVDREMFELEKLRSVFADTGDQQTRNSFDVLLKAASLLKKRGGAMWIE